MSPLADTKEKPKPAGPGHRPPPLNHLICRCQEQLGSAAGRAYCGARVGGPVKYLTPSAQAPMTVCVVCYEMRAAKAICPMCGRPAGSLS
jgi:hypothetical protein